MFPLCFGGPLDLMLAEDGQVSNIPRNSKVFRAYCHPGMGLHDRLRARLFDVLGSNIGNESVFAEFVRH